MQIVWCGISVLGVNNNLILQFGWHPSNTTNTTLPIAYTSTYSVIRDLNYGGGSVIWAETNGYDNIDNRSSDRRTLTWFSTTRCNGDWIAIGY